jgi:hypothetical protein
MSDSYHGIAQRVMHNIEAAFRRRGTASAPKGVRPGHS